MPDKFNFSPLVENAIKKDTSSIIKMLDSRIQYYDKELKLYNNEKKIIKKNISSIDDLNNYLSKAIKYMLKINTIVFDVLKSTMIMINDKYTKNIINKNIKVKFIDGNSIISSNIDSVKTGYKVFNSVSEIIIKRLTDITNDHIILLELTQQSLPNYFSNSNSQLALEELIFYYDKFNEFIGYNTTEYPFKPIFNSNQGSSLIDNMLLENLESVKLSDLSNFLEMLESTQIDINEIIIRLAGITSSNFSMFKSKKPWYIEFDKECFDKGILSNKFLSQFSQVFYSHSSNKEIFDYICENIFKYNLAFKIPPDITTVSEKIDFIKDNILLTILKYNAIIEEFINAIKINFSILYINYYSEYRDKVYEEALDKKRFKSANLQTILKDISKQDLDIFNDMIRSNLDSYIHYNGELLDFNDIGVGEIIVSPYIIYDNNKVYNQLLNLDFSSKILTYIAAFEISIITHGYGEKVSFIDYYNTLNKIKNKTYDYHYFCSIYFKEISYLEKVTNKPINKITGDEIININIHEFTKYNSFIIRINNKEIQCINGKIKKNGLSKSNIQIKVKDILFTRWIITSIKTPYRDKPFTDMECLLARLLFEGYRKINCLVCNPKGVIFSNDMFKDEDNKIAISIHNLYS